MKKYTFELVILEGNDEFWEGLLTDSGCDEVRDLLREMLNEHGFYSDDAILTLKKFEDL